MYALTALSQGQWTRCPEASMNTKKKRKDEETVGGRVPVHGFDVIGGRGRFNFQQQPGNDRFDALVGHYAPLHRSGGGSMAMSKIHIAVMAQLPAGSRFMTDYDRETNTAVQLTPGAARIKIGQAIRYRNSPKYKKRFSLPKSLRNGDEEPGAGQNDTCFKELNKESSIPMPVESKSMAAGSSFPPEETLSSCQPQGSKLVTGTLGGSFEGARGYMPTMDVNFDGTSHPNSMHSSDEASIPELISRFPKSSAVANFDASMPSSSLRSHLLRRGMELHARARGGGMYQGLGARKTRFPDGIKPELFTSSDPSTSSQSIHHPSLLSLSNPTGQMVSDPSSRDLGVHQANYLPLEAPSSTVPPRKPDFVTVAGPSKSGTMVLEGESIMSYHHDSLLGARSAGIEQSQVSGRARSFTMDTGVSNVSRGADIRYMEESSKYSGNTEPGHRVVSQDSVPQHEDNRRSFQQFANNAEVLDRQINEANNNQVFQGEGLGGYIDNDSLSLETPVEAFPEDATPLQLERGRNETVFILDAALKLTSGNSDTLQEANDYSEPIPLEQCDRQSRNETPIDWSFEEFDSFADSIPTEAFCR